MKMAIVSINYNKISSEKSRKPFKGQISIKNNVSINNVAVGEVNANQKAIIIDFSFSIMYEPGIGNVSINGSVVDLEDEKTANQIAELWGKNKRIDKELTTKVISVVLEKCTIKAITLSQDIGLPSPVPLPRLKIEPTKVNVDSDDEIIVSKKQDNSSKDSKKKK
jgi:hypothetical protein